ncbi:MAG: hypothetical protein FJX77_15630, partial [Armatimonadetes bacterium]|nr:hypothetical protein [Armatimonadota bacterium]
AVARLAESSGTARWEVEALALRCGVKPLVYLRNLSGFTAEGQIRLLHSVVVCVGRGPVLARVLDCLAGNGVGQLWLRVALRDGEPVAAGEAVAADLAEGVRRKNPSCAVEGGTLALKRGNPAEALAGGQVVAAALDSAMEEQLLQVACRLVRLPLVLGAAQDAAGQALTVFPGDPGVALVYRPDRPHLDPDRSGPPVAAPRPAGPLDPRPADAVRVAEKAQVMVGTWIAEQVTRLLLDEGALLQGRLLYADLEEGAIGEHPLQP